MPGLRGPSDYSQEPPPHPSLVVNAKVSSYVTPVEFFYKRNHGPIPMVDDLDNVLAIGGLA